MKITIINSERNEKRYTREELEAFVAQLRDGTYRQQYVRDFNKEVCFAAEWVKLNGELKAKSYNDWPSYSPIPYSALWGTTVIRSTSFVHTRCRMAIRRRQPCSTLSASCITSIRHSWVRHWLSTSQLSKPAARQATIHSHSITLQLLPSLYLHSQKTHPSSGLCRRISATTTIPKRFLA